MTSRFELFTEYTTSIVRVCFPLYQSPWIFLSSRRCERIKQGGQLRCSKALRTPNTTSAARWSLVTATWTGARLELVEHGDEQLHDEGSSGMARAQAETGVGRQQDSLAIKTTTEKSPRRSSKSTAQEPSRTRPNDLTRTAPRKFHDHATASRSTETAQRPAQQGRDGGLTTEPRLRTAGLSASKDSKRATSSKQSRAPWEEGWRPGAQGRAQGHAGRAEPSRWGGDRAGRAQGAGRSGRHGELGRRGDLGLGDAMGGRAPRGLGRTRRGRRRGRGEERGQAGRSGAAAGRKIELAAVSRELEQEKTRTRKETARQGEGTGGRGMGELEEKGAGKLSRGVGRAGRSRGEFHLPWSDLREP
ncbi:uncharacterized protein LOC100383964 [Zea mays]|jgi:hypothetical protein|uniref:Uncharacterized protein n=1 Tax=Zea mays TaxID=4577 RepID=C0PKB4_MAIZE|nr:uncharacterized protein LOC100383964 [Zea mays]ACN35630.1 unknown [Zea mays]|eukprot:NP_001170049.1 uncharacterized protein LOC100383964 [Zea mays]